MEYQFKTITRGARHGAPNKEADVQRLTDIYVKSNLHVYEAGRKIKSSKDKAPDVVTDGAINLEHHRTIEKWWNNRTYPRSTAEVWTEDPDAMEIVSEL